MVLQDIFCGGRLLVRYIGSTNRKLLHPQQKMVELREIHRSVPIKKCRFVRGIVSAMKQSVYNGTLSHSSVS